MEKVIIQFKMDAYDLNGNVIMQEFEHGVKSKYFDDKKEKMSQLTSEQVAKWIIKQAYKAKTVEILSISRR